MKVTKEDSGLMIVKQRNILFFIIAIFFVILGFSAIFSPDLFVSEAPPLWFGLVFILFGFLAVFSIKITTIRLDRSENKISILKKRIAGRQNLEEFPIENVKEIELAVDFSSSSDGENSFSYQLYFVLKDGQNKELCQSVTSTNKPSSLIFSSQIKVGKRIADFLGVPFLERRPPTVQETLSTISKTIKDSIINARE
ncbi:MAG TPA: hypothetical protein PLZ70_01085 [Candidatus Paceibacterota bacterium]|jgi:hypothetical protein|nr:hypothetical protein [Candidatus Paceibacterota bacterium]HPI66596.1 hypothetical protein [Candidatus Paceibacterota bacterium]HQC46256.1 hypothetical protein [Candidatus Paceibacterota bacterium]HQM18911.1 hypothetical protein [Candidatus Paceibacterota bacterium]HQO70889.1 hypothetical protein [Candidatus Paceibacterota bacterium]